MLDADIAKCFDQIDHNALLSKLNTFPTIRRQIRVWLKAGVIDFSAYANRQKSYSKTTEGAPQGGCISPLLANIALHGMSHRIQQAFPKRQSTVNENNICISSPELIRFADNFVILHEDITVVQRCQQIIAEWLGRIGLELKPSKTRITHTLNKSEGRVGFDFLGFTVRQFPVGKYHSQSSNGELLGFKTLITPSKTKLKAHMQKVGKLIDGHKSVPQADYLPPQISDTFNILYDNPSETSPNDYRFDICASTERDVADNAFGVVEKNIPGGRCAVLRHIGDDANLGESITYLYSKWLPLSGEEPRDFPLFLHRVSFFPDVPEHEAITDIFLPLK